jgi:hypothetical protein
MSTHPGAPHDLISVRAGPATSPMASAAMALITMSARRSL